MLSADTYILPEQRLVSNMVRMLAAYKSRLAAKADKLGGQAPDWEGRPISIEEEQRLLLAEDRRRIAPYPYPGLRSFDTEEGEIFFGRERNVEEVRALLAQNHVVAVLGGSGAGKSSLLRAGLLPYLNTKRRIPGRIGNWYRAEFRPRTRPLYELSSALAEQLMLPLLKLKAPTLAREMGIPSDVDLDNTAGWLRSEMHRRFSEASERGREAVLLTFVDIVDHQLDRWDNISTGGRRLSEPSLFHLVDQLEEAFRPEVQPDERNALLNLIVDAHSYAKKYAKERKGGAFLALAMRSEELHRCAEHRGLSDVVVGSGYQLELLDPNDDADRADLRLAIVQPARNVFEDWGLGGCLGRPDEHPDAPFSPGMPDLLLKGAACLAKELEHRPDQLPLLQHALQATWHRAMKRWSRGDIRAQVLSITPADLPGYREGKEVPDLGECLNLRADDAELEAAEHFAVCAGTTREIGEQALRATFRSLARRDDHGNWARRFAGCKEIKVFLGAELNSPLATMPIDLRWKALQIGLNSFLVRGYLNRSEDQNCIDYDISHEALIRNWRQYQVWLRDPGEVAYSLTRVLLEVEEPDKFANKNDEEKIRLIPQDLARRVSMVSPEGQLPATWGEDQIEPVLQRSSIRARWGASKSEALHNVLRLSRMADEARERVQQKLFRKRYSEVRAKKRARRSILISTFAAISAMLALLAYYFVSSMWAVQAQKTAEMRRITALARDALWSDGPATAILIASHVRDFGLAEAPEAEHLLLTSLHQLREDRVLGGRHRQMVNGVSYSPDGEALVTSDPGSILFSHTNSGSPIDRIELSYLPIQGQKFTGPFFGVQWSPGGDWIAVGSREQTMLIAPCSRKELKGDFVACEGQDEDIVRVLGDSQDRAGQGKFSADGKWLVTGGFGTSVKLWNIAESPIRKQREFNAVITWPNAFAISSDMQTVAAGVGQTRGEIKLFDSTSGALKATLGVGEVEHGSIVAIAFNPSESRMLAASTLDGNIFVWEDWSDAERAQSPIKLENARGTAFQIAFSRDGGLLVGASDDGVLRIWATRDGETDTRWRQVGPLRGHKGPVWAIAVSPDGRHIASGSTDGSIISWNSGSAFHQNEAHGASADASSKRDLASCIEGLKLPHDFGTPAACVRSARGRVVVASGVGRLEVFNGEPGALVVVDKYRVARDVEDLALDGDRLVVRSRSGSQIDWPFFDSLDALITYSLAHLPYERAARVALPKDLLCRMDDRADGCEP